MASATRCHGTRRCSWTRPSDERRQYRRAGCSGVHDDQMESSFTRIAQQLREEADALTEQSAAKIAGRIEAYRGIPSDVLLEAVAHNVDHAVATIEAGTVHAELGPPERTFALLRQRIGFGLRIEDLIRAYRLNLAVVHQRFLELANEDDLMPELTLAGSELLWELSDQFISSTIEAYQHFASSQAVRSSLERADLVRELLRGGGKAVEVGRLRALGVDPGARYAAVIATPVNGDVERLIPRLEEFGSTTTARGLATQIAGQCVGVVASRPDQLAMEALVSIGDWVEIAELPSSMATAQAVSAVADVERPGLHDLSTETWRLAVARSPSISSHLWEAYVAPFEPHTEVGDQMLHTLATFLTHGRSVRETAEALFVHQNTVRYRITHYEGLVGRSLTETGTLVELAWALEVERQRQRAKRDGLNAN